MWIKIIKLFFFIDKKIILSRGVKRLILLSFFLLYLILLNFIALQGFFIL